MPMLELDRVGLFYTDTGAGTGRGGDAPTLLLVHGWGGAGDQWSALLPHLGSAECRVIIPDLRGHGASRSQWTQQDWADGRVREEDFTPRAFAADLARLLTEVDAGPVVAIGHSMGGQVVTALAVEHPDLDVRALVVLDPAYAAGDKEIARIPGQQAALRAEGSSWAVRFVAGAFSAHAAPGQREREQRLVAATDARVLAAARDGMYLAPDAFGARQATAAYLERCDTPTLAIYSYAPAADWHRTHGLHHAESAAEVIPEVGHYLQIEKPEAVAELINPFVLKAG